jgi:hypothetical protein
MFSLCKDLNLSNYLMITSDEFLFCPNNQRKEREREEGGERLHGERDRMNNQRRKYNLSRERMRDQSTKNVSDQRKKNEKFG